MHRRRQLRWLAGGVSAALVATGATLLATASGARAATSPGQGSATAQALAVAPHDGSLAIGVTLGQALAGHTNGIAKAQSQGINLGAIGTALTGYNCGTQSLKANQIPQPLITETGSQGAANGITAQPSSPSSTQSSFGSTEFVKANNTPYGEADTSFAPVNAGDFTIQAMSTKAWSGLVSGQRQAGATVDIGAITIAGVVKLGGLHWGTVYPSGGSAKPSGSFTMGSLQIAGATIPLGQSITALQSVINAALGPLGIELVLPQVTLSQGVEAVSPLQIEVVPNKTRDDLLNLALNATESQQQQLFGGLENGFPGEPAQLAAVLCQSDTPITVAQVALASINGGGYFSAGLGGVEASSSDVQSNPFSLGLLGTLGLSSGSSSGGSTLDTSGALGAGSGSSGAGLPTGATDTSGAGPAVGSTNQVPSSPSTASRNPQGSPAGGTNLATSPAASVKYSAGGPLLGIGLAGLGLLALLAEADRRMMRRAQYTANFEE